MYSTRRYYSRPKSRQYYRKKKINQKFSPAAYKNNIPTFYQQKGRILQTSPLKLYQVPRQIPNSKTLEQMYQILLKAKYPNVGPSQSFEYDGSFYNIYSDTLRNVFRFSGDDATSSIKIDSQWLSNYIENLPGKPPLPDGYKWDARILGFNIDYPVAFDYAQWHIDYNNPIISQPIQLVIKSNTATTSAPVYNYSTMLFPTSDSNLSYTQIYFTSSGMNRRYQTISTNVTINPELEIYPMIDTDNDENYFIDCTRDLTQTQIQLQGNITFYIIYRYIEDF